MSFGIAVINNRMIQHPHRLRARGIAAGLLCIATASPLSSAPIVDQARNFESGRPPVIKPVDSQPGLSLTEAAPASPGDQDLGEQRLFKYKEKDRRFTFSMDLGGFATSNVALVEKGRFDDQYLVGQVFLGYQAKLADNLFGDVSIREASFRYNRFTALDFDSQTFGVGLTYVAPDLWNVAFFGRYSYNRLLDATDGNEIFTNHGLTVGFQKTFQISRAHNFYAGYASQFGIGHPVVFQRDEHAAFFGYHADLSRSLDGDLFYRIAAYDYKKGGRTDLNETLNGSLQYKFTKWLRAYASASLALNHSNRDGLDYDAFTAGLGLTATFKF